MWPEIHPSQLSESLLEKTRLQIEKELQLEHFHPGEGDPYTAFMQALQTPVKDLMHSSGTHIRQAFYRIDLNEKTYSHWQQIKDTTEQIRFLSDAILRRCFMKVLTKQHFSK